MSRVRYNVVCPTCLAQPNEHCRSLTTRRVTDTHKARQAYQGWPGDAPTIVCRCATPWVGVAPSYGLSAYAIKHGGRDHPYDPSDLCRCLHVSPSAPRHMRDRSPEWRVLVDNWDELATMLRQEHPSGTGPRTYARMRQLFAEART